MWVNLVHGLTELGNGPALAYLFGGSLAGMFLGVVPGIGGVVLLSISLSFIYHINLTGAICLFLASYAASFFSASITSILLNTPAHPEAFAVTFDGFPMAQRGEAGRALGISATSTMIGGIIGCIVLVAFIPLINDLPGLFRPPEYVALIFLALLLVSTLGTNSASKALVSLGMGVMISTIGADPVAPNGSAVYRFTFGALGLDSGISLVALVLGLFAIPQMVLIFGTGTTVARQDMMGKEVESSTPVTLGRGFGKQVVGGIFEALHHWVALIRSGLIGVLTGLIPGIGGFAANFMSYGIAQQSSRHPELFGTGIPEGIIAPEGSSLSKEAGSLIPLIGLGIPGGVGGAIFLAALSIEGVRTGYGVTTAHPTLLYEMAWVVALGGLIGTVVGLLGAPILACVTRVPGPLIVPFVMSLAVIGPFVADISFFCVVEVLVFAVLGFLLRRLRYAVAVFAVGLVLGPTLEDNLYLTHALYPGLSFFAEQPIADVIFAIGIVILVVKSIQFRHSNSRADLVISHDDPLLNAEEVLRRERLTHPYPLLALVTSLGVAIFTIAFAVYGGLHYKLIVALMPCIGAGIAGTVGLWRIPSELSQYRTYRKSRSAIRNLTVTSNTPGLLGVLVSNREAEASHPRDDGRVPTSAEPTELQEESPVPPVLPLSSTEKTSRYDPIREKQWGVCGQYTREIVAFGWFGLLIAASFILGFNIAIPTFCGIYALSATRRIFPRWISRIMFGIFSGAVLWIVVFEIQRILHVSITPMIHF